jgi:hypothetical protein
LTFDHCFFVPVTASTWGFNAETANQARFIGGTVGPSNAGAWGISGLGYLYISGTHIEGIGGNYGVLYRGTAAYISPSACFGFDVGVQIGDGTAALAVGYTITSFAPGNSVADVLISPGGPRVGTITEIYGTILNQRWTTNGANEVAIVGANFGTARGSFTPTVAGTTTAGVGTYSFQSGLYQNLGLATAFSLQAVWSATTGTGNLIVNGIPRNAGFTPTALTVRHSGFAITAGSTLQAFVTNSSSISIVEVTAAGVSTALALPASGSLMISGTYFTYV